MRAASYPLQAFQLTRPRGARLHARYALRVAAEFQLTRPRGARLPLEHHRIERLAVSTHAPARGATSAAASAPRGPCCFNSRAREGRDSPIASLRASAQVSTHAPARGATGLEGVGDGLRVVSTHAPARGATTASRAHGVQGTRFNSRAREGRDVEREHYFRPTQGFNSRAREGRDTRCLWVILFHNGFNSRAREGRDVPVDAAFRLFSVSTHAPARGATSSACTATPRRSSFNSRAREGRDPFRYITIKIGVSFNSRAREGRDSMKRSRRGFPSGFNSRAREGRDTLICLFCYDYDVSTHAPARGATRKGSEVPSSEEVSTHAPARGATRSWRMLKDSEMFQLTRPRGARRPSSSNSEAMKKFQLTRPRGARLIGGGHHKGPGAVSTHAPARGATQSCRPLNSTSRCFNSRAREGRDTSSRRSKSPTLSFNSRAREGRDLVAWRFAKDVEVSTHAPARGATVPDAAGIIASMVSTHAPARGAT